MLESFDKPTKEKLQKHLELVLEKNKGLNLTRIESLEKGIVLHIEDSLSCLPEFEEDEGLFLDIGTGGGFPGIPLAIVTGRRGVLLDSVKKKARAVEEIVKKLGLADQLEVIDLRSEEYARITGPIFSTVVMRAVSSLPSIAELASPFLMRGGNLIALKGKESDASVETYNSVYEKMGLEISSIRNITLDDEYERTIVTFKKIREPSISLPRRNGMAQKRPFTA